MKKKIYIIASLPSSLINFRGELIKSLIQNNFEVFCSAPNSSTSDISEIKKYGANYIEIKFKNSSINPFYFFLDIFLLYKKIKNIRPNYLLAYTFKPIILSGLSSFLIKDTKFIPMITGLGYFFNNFEKKKVIKFFLIIFYKLSCFNSKLFIFQNQTDILEFKKYKIIPINSKALLVNGSGINLSNYNLEDIYKNKNIDFIMVSRLIHQKGLKDYFLAAKIVKEEYPNTSFFHIGGFDHSPNKISHKELSDWKNQNIVTFLGYKENVDEYLLKSKVFVLPTYYREGLPRSSLEALASGCSILTTDLPGCDQTVIDSKNGYIIPVNNHSFLANKMKFLIKNNEILVKFQKESLELSKKFDVYKINKQIINEIINL